MSINFHDKNTLLEIIIRKLKFVTLGQLETLMKSSPKLKNLLDDSIKDYSGSCVYFIEENQSSKLLKNNEINPLNLNIILHYKGPNKIKIHHIYSVTDYLNAIEDIVSRADILEKEVFYRGHGNINYIPIPSLFRKREYYENEKYRLINSLRNYSELKLNTDSSINKLKFIQHYETNTRLMDLTEDPLTALYFAVEKESVNDSEVLIYINKKSEVKFDNSDKVAMLSSLSKLTHDKKVELEDYIANNLTDESSFEIDYVIKNKNIENYLNIMETYNNLIQKFNENLIVNHLIHEISKERPHFQARINPRDLITPVYIRSTWDNDRVLSQRGSFVIPPLNDTRLYKSIKDLIEKNEMLSDKERNELRFISNNINFISKTNSYRWKNNNFIIIRINNKSKLSIKRTLEKLNINQSRIYPSLEEVIDYTVDLFEDL